MAGASAGHERDLRLGGIGTEVYDFVLGVEGSGGVGEGYRLKGGQDEVCWVVDEVFGFGSVSWRFRGLRPTYTTWLDFRYADNAKDNCYLRNLTAPERDTPVYITARGRGGSLGNPASQTLPRRPMVELCGMCERSAFC